MKETIKAQWLNDLSFEAEVDGHKIYMDTAEEHGGKNLGPRPKLMMMVALAGCTGMDVAAILKKMRENLEDLSVEVEGNVTEEHPKREGLLFSPLCMCVCVCVNKISQELMGTFQQKFAHALPPTQG